MVLQGAEHHLLAMAAAVDAGFDRRIFATVIATNDRLADEDLSVCDIVTLFRNNVTIAERSWDP